MRFNSIQFFSLQIISSDRFIPCLIKLCKSFWCILVCYYQVALWHHSIKPPKPITNDPETENEQHHYIQQKFKTGYSRIWNDIQSKLSVFLSTSQSLHTLKYEQFIQVLSIVQRLRKVGMEFCNEPSYVLVESMKCQSVQFFQRYHKSCLDEIRLFLDNEAWMPVHSFSDLTQLQEFSAVKASLERFMRREQDKMNSKSACDDGECRETSSEPPARLSPSKRTPDRKNALDNQLDENLSSHSQEDCSSSVYGSCGYFLRFSEKSSPFDGGFDEAMREEDILAGIADESSCYFSEESEEEQIVVDDLNATANANANANESEPSPDEATKSIDIQNTLTNNSSLNVLRCIGRYVQMCKLLHSISPQIVECMTELIEFYIYVVHELFAADMPFSSDNLYTAELRLNLNRISTEIVPKVTNWRLDASIVSSNRNNNYKIEKNNRFECCDSIIFQIRSDLCDPDTAYGLLSRIVGIESGISLVRQFSQIREYLEHLLLASNSGNRLSAFFVETSSYLLQLRKPIYMCVAARIIDLDSVLSSMAKVKWDINHVNVEHSAYVNNINRVSNDIQSCISSFINNGITCRDYKHL